MRGRDWLVLGFGVGFSFLPLFLFLLFINSFL